MKKENKIAHRDYVVIDVRDDDFRGGNIKGCIHIPSESFELEVDGLVERIKAASVVIFHCALSQLRCVHLSM